MENTKNNDTLPILELNDVSIRYITGDFKEIGIKEFFLRKITGKYKVTEFWADRHVTFSLMRGDMLGIIGTNGAGKSTLLKAVSKIMVPTEGTVECRGKIAALLELGSGFDGDLTVKENTYLRGAMLGYTKKFMDETYLDIIRFAELEDYQDRAFKHLSSGMKSRLAFSIASLVNPDILILDEVKTNIIKPKIRMTCFCLSTSNSFSWFFIFKASKSRVSFTCSKEK